MFRLPPWHTFQVRIRWWCLLMYHCLTCSESAYFVKVVLWYDDIYSIILCNPLLKGHLDYIGVESSRSDQIRKGIGYIKILHVSSSFHFFVFCAKFCRVTLQVPLLWKHPNRSYIEICGSIGNAFSQRCTFPWQWKWWNTAKRRPIGINVIWLQTWPQPSLLWSHKVSS